MQVNMFSFGLYLGEFQGIEQQYVDLMNAYSLLLTSFIMLYPAQPFFRSAYHNLRNRQLGMDVPVSFAILFAYLSSVLTMLRGQGEVYFDTVSMFVFLLLLARYIELCSRAKNVIQRQRLLPLTANKKINQEFVIVGINTLNPTDEILVKPGEIIPADGLVLQGVSSVNEAIFTGEHLPINKQPQDTVLAGTLNHDQALVIQVQSVRSAAKLNHIENLVQQALTHKPQFTQLVDHLSRKFIAVVLLITVLAGWYWYLEDAPKTLAICLAVLVASCPCALSLATPSALAVAANYLRRRGFLICQPQVLETVAQASTIIFDKTGTLTQGKLSLGRVHAVGSISVSRGLALARALEIYS
jgi:Cu2+-exporting ATPase